MSTEKRSAFSRAVRSINPDQRLTVGNVAFGPISERTEFVPPVKPPDATVSHYSCALALSERDKARADCAELRAMLDELLHTIEPADWASWAIGSEVARARALLARLDAEGKT